MEARPDRTEQDIRALAGVTGELAREVRSLVQGLAADRVVFRETLRELSGFVAAISLEIKQLTRELQRLAEMTESGLSQGPPH